MSSNVQRLGSTLSSQMKRAAAAAIRPAVELGKINKNLSLTVDSIGTPIPKGDYMISLSLTHKNYYTYNELNSSKNEPHHHAGGTHTQESGSGYHTHDDGLHDHRVPSVFRRLKEGDRVLVLWVGHQPIIADIVVSGDTISTNEE